MFCFFYSSPFWPFVIFNNETVRSKRKLAWLVVFFTSFFPLREFKEQRIRIQSSHNKIRPRKDCCEQLILLLVSPHPSFFLFNLPPPLPPAPSLSLYASAPCHSLSAAFCSLSLVLLLLHHHHHRHLCDKLGVRRKMLQLLRVCCWVKMSRLKGEFKQRSWGREARGENRKHRDRYYMWRKRQTGIIFITILHASG